MVKHRKKTKDRLLASACAVFSEKGYRDTTIAEICEAADANVAAVNYHFGDKSSLYNKAVRHAWDVTNDSFPMPDVNDTSLPAEDRLRGFIDTILRRQFCESEGGWMAKFMKHEFTDPTEWNEEIFEELIGPARQRVMMLISELLDSEDPSAIRCCMYSLMSQCLHLKMNVALRKLFARQGCDASDMLEPLSKHVYTFTLAGIREKSKELNEGGTV